MNSKLVILPTSRVSTLKRLKLQGLLEVAVLDRHQGYATFTSSARGRSLSHTVMGVALENGDGTFGPYIVIIPQQLGRSGFFGGSGPPPCRLPDFKV
jgi:hypothetical protein